MELVNDGKLGSLNEDQAEILTTVYKSAEYMLQLINTVLDLAKIEHGEIVLDITFFSFPELMTELFLKFEPLICKKQLQLTIEHGDLSLIMADRQRLKQVLINLINNALKFTDHGTIDVYAWEDMQDILITIQDTGIGIPEDKLAQIFQPFSRIETPNTEGTGLGLYISKIIVGLHGGNIQVKSTVQKGTMFSISIPSIL